MGDLSRRARVYTAGPISSSGDYETNIRHALETGIRLFQTGVINPYIPHLDNQLVKIDPTLRSWSIEEWMAFDLPWVAQCDAIWRIEGVSRGADLEVEHAQALGIPVFLEADADGWQKLVDFAGTLVNETVTDEAGRLVYGSRQAAYGHPRENFQAMAALFQAYLEARYFGQTIGEIQLQPEDAAALLLQMKIARLATGKPKRDTIVDIAGYAGVIARVVGVDQ